MTLLALTYSSERSQDMELDPLCQRMQVDICKKENARILEVVVPQRIEQYPTGVIWAVSLALGIENLVEL